MNWLVYTQTNVCCHVMAHLSWRYCEHWDNAWLTHDDWLQLTLTCSITGCCCVPACLDTGQLFICPNLIIDHFEYLSYLHHAVQFMTAAGIFLFLISGACMWCFICARLCRHQNNIIFSQALHYAHVLCLCKVHKYSLAVCGLMVSAATYRL